jgi:hypothetical protein
MCSDEAEVKGETGMGRGSAMKKKRSTGRRRGYGFGGGLMRGDSSAATVGGRSGTVPARWPGVHMAGGTPLL